MLQTNDRIIFNFEPVWLLCMYVRFQFQSCPISTHDLSRVVSQKNNLCKCDRSSSKRRLNSQKIIRLTKKTTIFRDIFPPTKPYSNFCLSVSRVTGRMVPLSVRNGSSASMCTEQSSSVPAIKYPNLLV